MCIKEMKNSSIEIIGFLQLFPIQMMINIQNLEYLEILRNMNTGIGYIFNLFYLLINFKILYI